MTAEPLKEYSALFVTLRIPPLETQSANLKHCSECVLFYGVGAAENDWIYSTKAAGLNVLE